MDCFDIMKSQGIQFSRGLSFEEIQKIELLYGIQFPLSLKKLFSKGIPTSKNFYQWNDFSEMNIQKIKVTMLIPFQYISEYIEELEWLDERVYPNMETKIELSKKALQKAPILIPLYGHRYMPIINSDDPPVLSVHGFDVIYYGKNLNDWAVNEFVPNTNHHYLEKYMEFVPFWSEIC